MEATHMQKRHKPVELLVVALYILGTIMGCSSHLKVAPTPAGNGFIILNSAGRAAYGIGSDSLPEVESNRIPQEVRSAATRQAVSDSKDPQCNRYFVGGQRVVVLLAASCHPNEYLADGLALVGYDLSGKAVGRMVYWLSDFVTGINPASRTY
jgi:hypothetical protein